MKYFKIYILIIPLILFVVSCCGGNNTSEEKNGNKSVAADVFKKPAQFAGDTIQVNCIVIGWKGSSCSFAENAASQQTRSDWIVKWDEHCIYVSGGIPEFIKLFDNSCYGREVVLKAVIRLDKESKVYLEYIKCNELVSK